jgi:hypothetical protein
MSGQLTVHSFLTVYAAITGLKPAFSFSVGVFDGIWARCRDRRTGRRPRIGRLLEERNVTTIADPLLLDLRPMTDAKAG